MTTSQSIPRPGDGLVFTATDRGFALIRFMDRYGLPCSLQKSSLATEDAVWFGPDGHRAHLTRAMVAELLPALHAFVTTGELPPAAAEDERAAVLRDVLRRLPEDRR